MTVITDATGELSDDSTVDINVHVILNSVLIRKSHIAPQSELELLPNEIVHFLLHEIPISQAVVAVC